MDINRYTPSYGVKNEHLTALADYSTEEIFEILYATKVMKGKFCAHEDTRILEGVTIALLFGDTSLRTRSAIEIGVRQLGAECVDLPYSEDDMRAGENISDVVKAISRYGVGALITRGINYDELKEFCAVSPMPVINSTNDYSTPLQTLSDLYTIWEKKNKLEGLKLAYVGKGCSNSASLIMGAIKCGLDVSIATPKEYALPEKVLDKVRQYGNLLVTQNPIEAVKNADIVYTDNYNYHSSVTEKERETMAPYQVNNSLMSVAAHGALFMHSLPANRGVEVMPEIIDGKSSLVLEQAENKLHAVKATLALLIK